MKLQRGPANRCPDYLPVVALALAAGSPVFSQNWWNQPALGDWAGAVLPLNENQTTMLNPAPAGVLEESQTQPVDPTSAPDPNWDLNHQGVYFPSIDFLCYLTGLPTNDPAVERDHPSRLPSWRKRLT